MPSEAREQRVHEAPLRAAGRAEAQLDVRERVGRDAEAWADLENNAVRRRGRSAKFVEDRQRVLRIT